MDSIFEHPVFDSAREKLKRVIRQLEKSQETFENLLHTCFKCGRNKIFSIEKQVRSAAREHLCPMSAEIATINGEMDDKVEWVFFDSLEIITSYVIQQPKSMRKFILYT